MALYTDVFVERLLKLDLDTIAIFIRRSMEFIFDDKRAHRKANSAVVLCSECRLFMLNYGSLKRQRRFSRRAILSRSVNSEMKKIDQKLEEYLTWVINRLELVLPDSRISGGYKWAQHFFLIRNL